MNNHPKIISLRGAPFLLKYGGRGREGSKKGSSEGPNFFGQKVYGEVILNGRTNDQIMPR